MTLKIETKVKSFIRGKQFVRSSLIDNKLACKAILI